jgi:hypothetical protein
MGDAGIAAAIALPLSCLIVAIEITRSSGSSLRGICRGSTLLYLLIVSVGNIFTTFLAAATTSQQIPSGAAPKWFWYAFLGVFGFEAILKNVNLTFAGIGVLSINDWIVKAKDAATADVIEAEVLRKEEEAVSLAKRLAHLSVQDLNAHVINILGTAELVKLNSVATQGAADPQLVKALALAKGNYRAALAIAPV